MKKEKKPRILIVDDERLNINVLNDILKEDYQIKVAMNGEQALKRAVSDPRPEMVLLDIQMPDMSGYTVCRRLKNDPETKEIPVIFITALTDEADEQKGLAEGAVDYIAKPLRPAIIQARVKTHLGLKRTQETLAERNAELEKMLSLRETVEHISRHDLKTPLTGILGVTELLTNEDYILPEHKELIALQERAGYNMLEMINRSLDMLKMEQGSYVFSPQPVDLLKVFQRVLAEVSHSAIHLLVNGHPAAPKQSFFVQGEELLCYSMFCNLIKNAVEASCQEEYVTISMVEGEQPLVKKIKIQNPGTVPEAIRERFFEKYVTVGKQSGTGLGTYSAKLIAETFGGKIYMDTSDEVGTVVTISLTGYADE